MTTRRKLTDEVIAKIQGLRRRGLKIPEIAKVTGLSVGSVHRAIKLGAPAKTAAKSQKRPPKPRSEPASDEEAPEDAAALAARLVAASGGGDFDPVPVARGVVDTLDELRKVAAEQGDASQVATLSRALVSALSTLAKLQPPPTEDPNDRPDFQSIAEATAAKLLSMVDREIAKRAEAKGEGS